MGQTEMDYVLKQGEDFFSAGEIEKAKGCFERILADDPNHVEALNNLGVIYFHEDDIDKAALFFHRALEIDNAHVKVIENLTKCLVANGDLLEAVSLFQKALKLGIFNTELLNSMANCFIQLNDFAEAGKVLNESFRIDNSQEEIRYLLNKIENAAIVSKVEPIDLPCKKGLNIGFVSIWFERGQSYITKTIRDVVKEDNNTFVFARTGSVYGESKLETMGFWNIPNLTTYPQYQIPTEVLSRWIRDNRLDLVVFNEEYDWNLVRAAKDTGTRIMTYLDFYREDWKPFMGLYDAVLCSTLRSFNMVKDCCNAHYVSWAVDTDLFRPQGSEDEKYTFFHNAGWLGVNYRKMTPSVILAFDAISRHLPGVTLFVHAQTDIEKLPPEMLRVVQENSRITYHVDTVPAPGLYHKGRIMVFPTKLEGLGLPLLEGMACGLPAIATDAPPMNEFVTEGQTGALVRVAETLLNRQDGVAFPETIVDVNDLALKMAALAQNPERIKWMGKNARKFVEKNLALDHLALRVNQVLCGFFQDHSQNVVA